MTDSVPDPTDTEPELSFQQRMYHLADSAARGEDHWDEQNELPPLAEKWSAPLTEQVNDTLRSDYTFRNQAGNPVSGELTPQARAKIGSLPDASVTLDSTFEIPLKAFDVLASNAVLRRLAYLQLGDQVTLTLHPEGDALNVNAERAPKVGVFDQLNALVPTGPSAEFPDTSGLNVDYSHFIALLTAELEAAGLDLGYADRRLIEVLGRDGTLRWADVLIIAGWVRQAAYTPILPVERMRSGMQEAARQARKAAAEFNELDDRLAATVLREFADHLEAQ